MFIFLDIRRYIVANLFFSVNNDMIDLISVGTKGLEMDNNYILLLISEPAVNCSYY